MSSAIRPAARSPRSLRSSTRSGSASIVLSASWTKPDAYFRRMFGLRKDILLRLGPSAYVQCQHAVPLSELVDRPQQRAPAPAGGADTSRCSRRPRSPPAGSTRSSPSTAPSSSARIKTPTLVVGAEDDIVTPAYFSEELARLIPGAEIKIFPRGGHAFTQVRAREFNQAVLPFLDFAYPGIKRAGPAWLRSASAIQACLLRVNRCAARCGHACRPGCHPE